MSENSNYWVVDYSICPERPQEPAGDNGVPSSTTYETIDYCNKKNSEDEKIIRFFAELATDACGGPGQEYYEELGLNYNKVMTWLEKQKEQDKCPEYCVMSDCMGCPIYEKKKGLKPAEGIDFTIYHPLKNGKGEYECIPYSFYGSLTSFSEDKDLIDFLRTCFYTEEECEEWIKEQTEELSMRLNGVMQEYVKAGKDEEDQEHRLKCYHLFWDALGDSEFFKQKLIECSYPYGRSETADRLVSLAECLEMDGDCLFNGYSGTECGKFLRDLARKQVECKQWSNDDKEMLMKVEQIVLKHWNGLSDSFYHKYDDENQDAESCYNWLKTLPERFNLQPKQEWSEEDEKIAKEIEEELWYPGDFPDYPSKEEIELYDDCQRRLDWFKNRLKSLRPQPHTVSIKNATKFGNLEYERGVKDGIQSEKSRQWKPSEEQMGTLKRWIQDHELDGDTRDIYPVFYSLLTDLQNL